jgi:uncharacterized protein
MSQEGTFKTQILMQEEFRHKDTILKVKCDKDIGDFVREFIVGKRQEIESYIAKDPSFETSLEPIALKGGAPKIAKIMSEASEKAGVGPLAAVAGTFSELLVKEAIKLGAKWVIAENGGDICVFGDHEFTISLYAGDSPLSNKVGFLINPGAQTYGICTSSASVGHSISFGKADSVTVFAKETPICDAFATAIANRVDTIEDGLDFAKEFVGSEIDGAVIVVGDKVGSIGKTPKIVKLP